MKVIKFIFLLISFLSIYSCNTKTEISNIVFDVQGLKTDAKFLERQEFHRVFGDDLILYERKNKDTIINLEVDSAGRISTKTWVIKIKSDSITFAENFMINRGVFLNAPIAYYDDKESYYFTVRRNIDNNIFLCKVLKGEGVDYLYITYYVPM